MPIHPNDYIDPLERYEASEARVVKDGITKRDYLAALAMQGLIAHYGYGEAPAADVQEIATWSVQLADALIEQLTD
ncbi:hypothetical protein [Pantanalinema sp. GBBB05]|uniref:hypothetical protein n=1 Tax=Pantanalinema sp. GBBB05 TaxID=2604139 RepID=UPI001DBABBB1|nr:hypothetical protein [Pantanalinema sp. GBBB05]